MHVEWETEEEISTHTHAVGDVESDVNQQKHKHDIINKKKMVYLTFDAGYENGNTTEILWSPIPFPMEMWYNTEILLKRRKFCEKYEEKYEK